VIAPAEVIIKNPLQVQENRLSKSEARYALLVCQIITLEEESSDNDVEPSSSDEKENRRDSGDTVLLYSEHCTIAVA